jgi:parallel beta-helix repeat protein
VLGRPARRERRRSRAAIFVVVVMSATVVAAVGVPYLRATQVASAATPGTTVGSASYPVPTLAVVVSTSGSDSAAGTADKPLRTLTRAIAEAASGSTIVLRAGSYHESVEIPSDKRLTIQSWPGEAVWLDGSSSITSWTASGAYWRAPWSVKFDHSPTYTRGAADNSGSWSFVDPAYPMAAHPDQIWINGVAQRQVASLSKVVPGSFFYDETGKTMWLGSSPVGQSVRASSLVTAIRVNSASSVVRGIGIRRYAPSVPDMGALTVERSGITIENVAITDSATTGLHVGSSHATSGDVLRNVEVANSGMLGISATYADNITIDAADVENNNVEHFNTGPVASGAKITRSRGIVVRNSAFRNNDGPGLWIDESSYNMNITGNDIRNNTKHGIALEISAKATVANNTVVANGGFGIKVNNTSSVTLSGNTFNANADRSVNLVQDTRRPTSATTTGRDPRQPFPDPTMTWLLGPVTVKSNIISNQKSGICMLCLEDYSHQRSAAQIGVTANSDSYVRPNSSVPKYVAVWSRGAGDPAGFTTLSSFQSTTGQEAAGSYSTTSPTTTAPAPHSVPRAPTSPSALPWNAQATVKWVAPSDDNGGPGSEVSGYVVTPYIGTTAQPAQAFDSRATTAVVTGLHNGATYTFKIAARNDVGVGTQSVATSPIVAGTPTAPTGVHASSNTTKTAVVSWTAPTYNGGFAINGYVVTPYVGGVAKAARVFSSTATSQTITGLTKGTTYTFRVAARNVNGIGVQSLASAPVVSR